MKEKIQELHKAIAKLGDFMPGTGMKNAFQIGSRATEMQNALVEVYQLGFAVSESADQQFENDLPRMEGIVHSIRAIAFERGGEDQKKIVQLTDEWLVLLKRRNK